MVHTPSLLSTLNLSDDELERFLDRNPPGPPDEITKRRHQRDRYRVANGIVIEMLSRRTAQECARVCPRDISSSGIGFIHRGPIACGTPVSVELPLRVNSTYIISGRVVRCFGLTADAYDVGVAFDELIECGPILAANKKYCAALPQNERK